jgi:hypothetical protein
VPKAREEHAKPVEAIEGGAVFVEMLGPAPHRSVPIEPKPGQIFEDRTGVFVAAAAAIDVFEAQQKAPPTACAACPPTKAENRWPRWR